MKLMATMSYKSTSIHKKTEECHQNPLCEYSSLADSCNCLKSPCDSMYCFSMTDRRCHCSSMLCNGADPMLKDICFNSSKTDEASYECLCRADAVYPGAHFREWTNESALAAIDRIEDPEVRRLATKIIQSRTLDVSHLSEDFLPTPEELFTYGLPLDQVIKSCSFEGQPCGKSNFTIFYNNKYGLCYIFNYIGDTRISQKSPLMISRYGSNSGLQLDLNDSVTIRRPQLENGARIVIHDSRKPPMILQDGITVSEKTTTRLQLSLTQIQRKSKPWGSCSDDGTVESRTFYNEHPYDQTVCQSTCKLFIVERRCRCLKRDFSVGSVISPATLNYPLCDLSNPNDATCIKDAMSAIANKSFECGCSPACKQKKFSVTRSFSDSVGDFYEFIRMIRSLRFEEGVITGSFDKGNPQLHPLIVKIFYKSLQIVDMQETPFYSWESLVANIGGNLGFFMGLTLITLLEVAEFLWDVVVFTFKTRFNKIASVQSDRSQTVNIRFGEQ